MGNHKKGGGDGASAPLGDATLHSYSLADVKDVFSQLRSSKEGLSEEETAKRLTLYGENTFTATKRTSQIAKFFSHFLDPLMLILLGAATISGVVGEIGDAILIVAIVLVGVLLNFYQEYSADNSLKKLLETVKTTSMVIRDGQKKEIPTSRIVPGDILALSSGNMIPADARIIEAKDFFVNQSSITGESYPSEKIAKRLDTEDTSLLTMHNLLFSGTSVVSGTAHAVVLKTGARTEFGKISSTLSTDEAKSEFEIGINSFSVFIMKLTFIMVIFIFLFNSFKEHDYIQSFMFAIAIAVGVTPELLPMVLSVTMTAGSKKMAKKGVIVKKLSAVPSFGSMNILCTDKTGTLTENKIEVVEYTDYLGKHSEEVFRMAYLNSSFQTGIRNPMDEAVLLFKKPSMGSAAKVDEVPYDFNRKRMSVVVREHKKIIMITKGAPEEILGICTHLSLGGKRTPFTKRSMKQALSVYNSLSSSGYRVLAVSKREMTQKKSYSKNDEAGMELVGFVSFLDPAKKDVRGVVEEMQGLGVEIKVITGDNELVTRKICTDVGLEVKGVLLGYEISQLQDDALRIKAKQTTIFARCSPEEKNRIISSLRSSDNVVGYLGDGINDAPSLKTADVGISVDNAVDVAKESADLVLTKKSLHDLKEGIIEGRKTFGNTMKYVMMTLSSNFGNMFSATGAILFLPFLPMLPVQILLNNLIYDFSQITIPSDHVDSDWAKKPKRWNLAFLKKFMYVFGPLSSLFDFLTFYVLYSVLNSSAGAFQTAWFMESLATQTLVIHVIRTKQIPFFQSMPSALLTCSGIACIAFGWALPYTSFGAHFGFVPLPLHTLLILGAIIAAYLVVVHIVKAFFYKVYDY